MRRIALLALVALVFSMCRRGGTTSPPGPPGGGDTTEVLYIGDVRYYVQSGTLVVILQFVRASRGDTVSMDQVWVESDTLDDTGMGQYVWTGSYRDTLRIGARSGSYSAEIRVDVSPVAPPVFLRPSQDTTLYIGDTFSFHIRTPALPLRFMATDGYVVLLDTLMNDTVFPLPDFLRNNPQTYDLYVEAWQTILEDTVIPFVFFVRAGGIAGPRRVDIVPAPSNFVLVVDSVDPDPGDTISVSPGWPVITWTPDTAGITWLVVSRPSDGYILWEITGHPNPDTAGRTLPFGPPVYYGREDTSRYVVSPYVPNPPDSLVHGDTFRIEVGVGSSVLGSVLYVP